MSTILLKGPKRDYIVHDTNTTIDKTAKDDWLRAQRRKFPKLNNVSNVPLQSPPPAVRTTLLNSSKRNERRHFCGLNTKSHLDNYF
ncbi:hypothetical protein JTB14_032759 [Gonioctena quinquepunctata]|nr:hypothetical protein JTB14_032759 [Gonioctena quinquepunctata]